MASKHSSETITTTRHDAIVGFLEGERVPYELLEHEPVMSAIAEARVAGRPLDEVAKTVVPHDGSAYVIAAIPAADRLDVHKLRSLLGASRRLQLASEDQIVRDFPSVEVGAATVRTAGPGGRGDRRPGDRHRRSSVRGSQRGRSTLAGGHRRHDPRARAHGRAIHHVAGRWQTSGTMGCAGQEDHGT